MNRRRTLAIWLAIAAIPVLFVIGLAWLGGEAKEARPKAVKRVNRADSELQSAAKTAHGRLPEFVDRLQGKRPGERFAIKGRFETEGGPEYLWIVDPVYSEGSFTGTVDQVPVAASVRKGDTVTVSDDNVYDWMISSNGKREGGFTEKALLGK